MFCGKCGIEINEDVRFCHNCGMPTGNSQRNDEVDKQTVEVDGQTIYTEQGQHNAYTQNNTYNNTYNTMPIQKSKLVAGLLQIFLGSFGVGRFYLGYTGIGVAQILTIWLGGLFTCGLASIGGIIWTVVDGVLILCDKVPTDASGIPLKE